MSAAPEQLLQPNKLELICGVKRVQMSPASLSWNTLRGVAAEIKETLTKAREERERKTQNDVKKQKPKI